MELIVPLLVFAAIFGGALLVTRRESRAVAHIARHQIAAVGVPAAAVQQRTPILDVVPRAKSIGQLAAKATREEVKSKSARLLLAAGSPMPLATYLLLRIALTFLALPLMIVLILTSRGVTPISVLMILLAIAILPNLPMLMIKRRARKRARAIELAMPDAMDLLVVCVEGGLSLDGGLQQVSQRTEGLLAAELRRLLAEISTGMARRDAFQGLAARSQSPSLAIFATAIVQADKMGTSIAATLRTLAESMRIRRRQAAETQARKAPIKMLPFLVIFMIPSLFIVILGPTVLAMIKFFDEMGR